MLYSIHLTTGFTYSHIYQVPVIVLIINAI